MRKKACWLALISAMLCALACGDDSTTGREVVLQTEVLADPEIAAEFTTQTGWSVRLTKAALSVGALYYFDGQPAFAASRPRPAGGAHAWLVARLRSAIVGVARAHPGHYDAGTALGQMTTPTVVDLMSTPVVLPSGTGITGRYRSARFVFAPPPSGPGARLLAGSAARIEGVARKADQTVYFALSATHEEIARSVRRGQVDGCVFAEQDVEADGMVSLRVVPRVWLNLVDFAELAPGSPAMPTEVPPGQTPRIAFALGLAQLSAYQFSFHP